MFVGPFNLILANGVKVNGSDVFNILDPDSGGAATFSVPLSADGSEPPTYWGARTMLEEATHNALKNMSTTEFKAYVDQLAAQRGRSPVGSITAFKNSLLMDDTMSFWQFVASKGLRRIETEAL